MSRVRILHASPHDAVLAHGKEGRTRDGQGGTTLQESPGRSHVEQGIQTRALFGPWPPGEP